MAFFSSSPFLISLLSAWLIPATSNGCFIKAIYSFGDSIADTGNLLRMGPSGLFNPIGHFPYGVTLTKPTGRCSDGLLIIDYLAMSLNLSSINPYMDKSASFEDGVNFAIAGATALEEPFFVASGVLMPYAASSLGAQLGWFDAHLSSICSTREVCAKKLEGALFLVGEIGGNDYNFAFYQGKRIHEVESFVPRVIQRIVDAIKKVIEAGGVHVVVPGNFPIGCMPSYLSMAEDMDSSGEYDDLNCLKDLNEFAMLHNNQLQEAINGLKQEYPQAVILYADYYQAFLYLLHNASLLGFDESSSFDSCCGGGGKHNFDIHLICGLPGTVVCTAPAKYISWDGIHLTQKAYRVMAQALIDSFIYPSLESHKIWKC
ncbi:hypothetical protein HPP92_019684 [Vanilla planifolia]|uniref:Uncharacterized protein n=1 Tax=Vanilla planifolia TaxID=51239 RepID=A0A835ULZ3_VANPL|nr:hypothetical protein HPP92_019684 [Vanilla planifolia]